MEKCCLFLYIRYGRDFAVDEATLIEWVARQLPAKEQIFLRDTLEKSLGKEEPGSVDVKPYDWSFRYLLDFNSLTPRVFSKLAIESRPSPRPKS